MNLKYNDIRKFLKQLAVILDFDGYFECCKPIEKQGSNALPEIFRK